MFNLCVDDLERIHGLLFPGIMGLNYGITCGLLMPLVFLVTLCYFILECLYITIYIYIYINHSHLTCLYYVYMYIASCYINCLLFLIVGVVYPLP